MTERTGWLPFIEVLVTWNICVLSFLKGLHDIISTLNSGDVMVILGLIGAIIAGFITCYVITRILKNQDSKGSTVKFRRLFSWILCLLSFVFLKMLYQFIIMPFLIAVVFLQYQEISNQARDLEQKRLLLPTLLVMAATTIACTTFWAHGDLRDESMLYTQMRFAVIIFCLLIGLITLSLLQHHRNDSQESERQGPPSEMVGIKTPSQPVWPAFIIIFAVSTLPGVWLGLIDEINHSTFDEAARVLEYLVILIVALILGILALLMMVKTPGKLHKGPYTSRWFVLLGIFALLAFWGAPFLFTSTGVFRNFPLLNMAWHVPALFLVPVIAVGMVFAVLKTTWFTTKALIGGTLSGIAGMVIGILGYRLAFLSYAFFPITVFIFGVIVVGMVAALILVQKVWEDHDGMVPFDAGMNGCRTLGHLGLMAIFMLVGLQMGIVHIFIDYASRSTSGFILDPSTIIQNSPMSQLWLLYLTPLPFIITFLLSFITLLLKNTSKKHSRYSLRMIILVCVSIFMIIVTYFIPEMLGSNLVNWGDDKALRWQVSALFAIPAIAGMLLPHFMQFRLRKVDIFVTSLAMFLGLVAAVVGWQIELYRYEDWITPLVGVIAIIVGFIALWARFLVRRPPPIEAPPVIKKTFPGHIPVPRASRVAFTLAIVGIMLFASVPLLLDGGQQFVDDDGIWRDPNASIDDRVADLLGRLTIKEKILMLQDTFPGVPRLGILPHYLGNEALHGIVRPGKFTVFPQTIGLAATFDPEAIYTMMDMASDESRALYNAQGGIPVGPYCGMLTFFSPNVNMARDPRWGRTAETYGEDPWLVSRMAVAFVKGLQGTPHDMPRNYSTPLKAVATLKHYVANNEESWTNETTGEHRSRHTSSSGVTEYWLRNYYFSGFRAGIIEAGSESVMSAYNAISIDQDGSQIPVNEPGVPCCGHDWLLNTVLRDEWGHKGYVVTDCGGIGSMVDGLHYAPTKPQAIGVAFSNGVDIECGNEIRAWGLTAFDRGLLTIDDINRACSRILRSRFLLGQFDSPGMDPYANLTIDNIGAPGHAAHALALAERSMVLLKNDPLTAGMVNGTLIPEGPLLPLDLDTLDSIAVVGRFADRAEFGDYSGASVIDPISPLKGIVDHVTKVNKSGDVSVGTVAWTDDGDYSAEVALASGSDVAIVVVGIGRDDVREGWDRLDMDLADSEEALINAVAAANPRTIVLLTIGSAVTMSNWLDNVPAVLNQWYGGQSGGIATAGILFGEVNPSGHLPITFYASDQQLPSFHDYDIAKGRTYMFLDEAPLFPFGFGLDYVNFSYGNLSVNTTTIFANQTLGITLNVHNHGGWAVGNANNYTAEDVVQVYVRKVDNRTSLHPYLQLKGFKRIAVAPNQSISVEIPLHATMLQVWDAIEETWVLEQGTYEIMVGRSATDIVLTEQITVL